MKTATAILLLALTWPSFVEILPLWPDQPPQFLSDAPVETLPVLAA